MADQSVFLATLAVIAAVGLVVAAIFRVYPERWRSGIFRVVAAIAALIVLVATIAVIVLAFAR